MIIEASNTLHREQYPELRRRTAARRGAFHNEIVGTDSMLKPSAVKNFDSE